VLNDHVYCCSALTDVCTFNEHPSPESVFFWKNFCKVWTDTHLSLRSKDAADLGVPLIMSEFGACTDLEPCVIEVAQVTDACDNHLASWAYWNFKPYKDITTTAGTSSEGFYNQDGTL
jgi:hypothetical protein